MTNLVKRALTGALFVAVLVGAILWNHWTFSLLFLFITILGVWEFYILAEKENVKVKKLTAVTGAALLFSATYFAAISHFENLNWLFILIPYSFLMFIHELFRKEKGKPFTNLAFAFMGWIYVALPLSLLNLLALYPDYHTDSYNPELILGFFLILWANDTFAYLIGSAIGKNALFKRISPKKTWEGSVGGALSAIFIAFVIALFFTTLPLVSWMIIAGIIVVAGTFGDLVESRFKRSLNIKDSGRLLPGHGGILDRFDAVFFAAPFVITYLVLFT